MTFADRVIYRITFELRLAEHVLHNWRRYLLPLSSSVVGLVYCVSPINLISDPRFFVGHLDEGGFILTGFAVSRWAIAVGSARSGLRSGRRITADPAERLMPGDTPWRIADQVNLGHMVLNPLPHSFDNPARTIIISGLARGGTSMVAKVVRESGIRLGDTADPVVHEDVEMACALRKMRRAPLRLLINSRNLQSSIWGFKFPNLHDRLTPWDMLLFRNPHVILVIRDPVAVAQRNVVSMHGDPALKIAEAFRDIGRLGQFACRLMVPVLLLSYEKAIAKPDISVPLIAAFCGVSTDQAARLNAQLIQPEDEAYLRAARLPAPGPPPPRIRHRAASWLRDRFGGTL